MIKDRLERFVAKRRCTLLGVGPMSQNCVDATIELANHHRTPIMLIASRRQIEMADMGGGYVNNWSTETFSRYVIERDKNGMVILARDHGGLWQNTFEVDAKMSFRQAMESCKRSYEADILSGFELIHIDPSVDIFAKPTVDEILQRVFELYDFCNEVALRNGKKIAYEVGTEEQNSGTQNIEQLHYVLSEIFKFCDKNKYPRPMFMVAQTGTKVMEDKNVGTFDSPFRIEKELPVEIQLPRTLDLCKHFNVWLKEHNTDYLSDESLSWHPKLGINAANVAPEFGVEESRAFVRVLRENQLEKECEMFMQLSYDHGKWKKWMLKDTKATDQDRAIIGGHYTFSTLAFAEIKEMAGRSLAKKDIDLDTYLKNAVKKSIMRYITAFNLTEFGQ